MMDSILFVVCVYTLYDLLYNINVFILAKKELEKKNDIDTNILFLKTLKSFAIDVIIIFVLWHNN